jgi:hypothetical protein
MRPLKSSLSRLVCAALLLVLAAASPGWTRTAMIETAAPLTDRSDRSLELALKSAVDTCVRGATAMGLSWIWLRRAAIQGEQLVVQMIATDEDDANDEEDDPPLRDLPPSRRVL